MLPDGCVRDCSSRAAEERAEQLAKFQLFGAVFLAFIYVLGCYTVAAARYGHLDLAAVHDKHVSALELDSRGGGGHCVEECL
ncbi:unnamed protein product [Miscanthus lutarioriparius]|uniref:Uncharacterized protein n=1 Tax=Miscanthus lutarioriparius TaxID=422564 RepID=A0A811RH01_9POAL|nr:unnamed protein product [Miscanthus lutarioriparius]